ncbi:MAG: hypothetical protein U9Q72_02875 [Patescibacteria group bacterium]|nr:hypothetical protein [candidate division Zixibacteria bacterium]MEA3273510.1 hypothetical protein [Patescibacteria group bacterium]
MPPKPKKIDVDVNDFFRRIVRLKKKKKFANFLKFIKRVPKQSPLNDSLVFIQNCNCFYYATAKQWKNKFGRKVKDDAQPLIVLVPFGPVMFVYDIKDTKGKSLDKKNLFWWKEKEGYFHESIYLNTANNCKNVGIDYRIGKKEQYIFKEGLQTFGYAGKNINNNLRKIELHPKYQNGINIKETYGVLCHELAHHLLGHLGEIKIEIPVQMSLFSSKVNVRHKKIAPSGRESIDDNIKELEAELTAWIVFSCWGMEKNSEAYMANWLIDSNDAKEINYPLVFKVAGTIKRMALGKIA